MFRKVKKKPTIAAPKRSLDDEDDNGDNNNRYDMDTSGMDEQPPQDPSGGLLHMKKQRRHLKGLRAGTTTTTTGTSTSHRTTVRSVPKRPRGNHMGMGYGGGGLVDISATTASPINDTFRDTSQFSTSRYDSDSLSQLRQQQDFLPSNTAGGTADTTTNVHTSSMVPPPDGHDDWGNQTTGPPPGSNENSVSKTVKPNFLDTTTTTTLQEEAVAADEDVFGLGRNFIPIEDNPDSIRDTVLAGDEAFAYSENPNAASSLRMGDETAPGRTMDSVLGGIGAETFTTPRVPEQQHQFTDSGLGQQPVVGSTSKSSSTSLTLQEVHQQFSRTQERLQIQAEELEESLKRRQEAQEEAREQVNKHSQELKTTGSSLEFYQSWRRDLISFVGALREITKALPEMQNAWHELEQDMAGIQKWRNWEDDTVAVLARYNLLQSTTGRQPLLASDLLEESESAVDEFGRDIVSQKQRVLQQRRLERRRIRKDAVLENGIKPKIGSASSSDGSVSPHLNSDYAYPTGYPVLTGPSEMESFRERNTSLQHALKVVLEGLYEEYTSLPQLFELFAQWKRSFPAEYKECYASLTLADLATVLILVELLSLNDPLNESGGHDEAKWITIVCRHYDCVNASQKQALRDDGSAVKLFDKESIERLVSKAVLPTLQDLLSEKRTYNLLSARQSKALSTFFLNAKRLLPQDHPILRMLYRVVVDYIKNSLQDLSVPLIVQQSVALERLGQVEDPEERELLGQTIHDATIGQIERVKKIVLNLLDCWAKILPADCGLPSVILDFMASKVVPLLSALQTWYWPTLAESPADIFLQLWQEIQKHDWIERPENIIHSTVLKAAAEAFQSNPPTKNASPNMDDLTSDRIIDDLASDPILQQAR